MWSEFIPIFLKSHVDCNGTDRAFHRSWSGIVSRGHVSFRSKWLDVRTRDPLNGWIKKWGKLKELLVPLHFGVEDLLKILKLPDIDTLHYEVHYLSRYIDEEYLFKVGLSTQAGRSHAQRLKKSAKRGEGDQQASKKNQADEIFVVTSKGLHISPSKSYIPEDILKHQFVGRRQAEELLERHTDFKLEITKTLNDWNNKFVKVKYLQGEYKKKYDVKVKEMKAVEEQLAECRAELENRITSAFSQNERMDRLHIDLVEEEAMINQQMTDQQILEAEN
ncbi:hypothetical protein IEQ34_021740 [Dendrobium chrysotoxum]|uniref:Uncharacterized protein n=1 Tax=Dendrobium chrysotoxum TaxID=161865 RepID=A0AAV7G5J9_DENCH|nr:hypothetical protein IEQ34_021740 [Dendrobium chrysotoxum]